MNRAEIALVGIFAAHSERHEKCSALYGMFFTMAALKRILRHPVRDEKTSIAPKSRSSAYLRHTQNSIKASHIVRNAFTCHSSFFSDASSRFRFPISPPVSSLAPPEIFAPRFFSVPVEASA